MNVSDWSICRLIWREWDEWVEMFPSILTLKHPQGRWGSAARVLLLSQTFLRLQNKLQVRFLDWLIHTTERRPVNISTCWLTVGRQRLGTQTPDDVSAQPPCSLSNRVSWQEVPDSLSSWWREHPCCGWRGTYLHTSCWWRCRCQPG